MAAIYSFLDYREFLRQVYDERKADNHLYSYRIMAQGMEMDASYLAKVVTKALHIGPKQVKPIARYLKLSSQESKYFELLVQFSKTKALSESEAIFQKLSDLRPMEFRSLEAEQFELFQSWVHPALRSLLGVTRFDGRYRELGALLNPPVDAETTKASVRLLERLQLLRRTEAGDWEPVDNHMGTGSVFKPTAVREFQRQVSLLQAEALDRFPKIDRDISTLTVAGDAKALEDIRELVRNCRRAIQKRIDDVENPQQVFQINLGVFPLSQPVPAYQRKESL